MTEQQIRAEAAKEPGADHTWPLGFLVPALLLLRFLGEHAWAYWTAAVVGGPGVICAVFAIAGAARDVVRGRRPWKAAFALFVLAGGSFALVARLVNS
ncbi:hypothetical protein [Streptomyces xantholiticus]|uniref:hypothetical protein n=1 Tax=Streptomyces xantholiticus TaxID=68285 RepID=UPI0016776A38|nr:hypothetical protein [Streptomyces xantholiticus]GGW64222.1 hypothetical protein GCM10010381_56540 [Streptomyces xantholiticus]